MKKSELKQIIREEIGTILNEYSKDKFKNSYSEEFEDDYPDLDYRDVLEFIESKGFILSNDGGYYDGGFDVEDNEGNSYFVSVFDDFIRVADEEGDYKDFKFNFK